MSTGAKGKKLSAEHRANISAANLGKKIPDAIRAKIGATLRGKKRPVEIVAKISAARNKPCTVDGVKIYSSHNALVAELGSGKSGSRSPNFRYLEKNSNGVQFILEE